MLLNYNKKNFNHIDSKKKLGSMQILLLLQLHENGAMITMNGL